MDQSGVGELGALLEREDEVERVHTTLRAVGRRAGAALVIEGDAGLGKSRLLQEARARASELGFRVLKARATELEQGFPYGVVRQLFERLLLEADADERDRWLAGAAALAADVLASSPGTESKSSVPGPSASDPGYAWQHGLYWLASNLSGEAPLALGRRQVAVYGGTQDRVGEADRAAGSDDAGGDQRRKRSLRVGVLEPGQPGRIAHLRRISEHAERPGKRRDCGGQPR